ncbi:scabin-related ADP-ribosyltransferase [Xenorhabdus stockiae]|uniref:scabin-related ADP-ribosyltransferase n=1 Tax=Xenorhabdus stockiae TaxID=351614 RepID=UPI004064AF43
MRKFKYHFFSFLILFLFSLTHAYAIDWVYRVDNRAPNIIFIQGMTSWGTNQDLLEHVWGLSIHEHTSNYISTTTEESTIIRMARESNLSGTTIQRWAYQIRPSLNFYDIRNALTYAINDPATADRNRTQATTLRFMYDWQAEIAAMGQIVPSQIYRAQLLTIDNNGQVTLGEIINNPHYRNGNPAINNNILPLQGLIDEDVIMMDVSNPSLRMGLSFDPGCGIGPSRSSRTSFDSFDSFGSCGKISYLNLNEEWKRLKTAILLFSVTLNQHCCNSTTTD